MQIRDVVPLIKATFSAWLDDYAPSMGAALAYYTMFSIAPLLLIVISVAGLVFGADAVRGEIVGQLTGMMGRPGAIAIEGLLQSVSKPADSLLATGIGIVLLLVGATTVFGELQDALDRIWRAPVLATERKGSGLWNLLRTRLLSFGMILGIGFLLMISLVFSAALTALGRLWSPLLSGWTTLAHVIDLGLGFALTATVFAMIYKLMPRVQVSWRDVITGSIVTSFLFTIGKHLIGLYIGTSGITSGFGAAGSLVVVLVWVYYSAQIFLLGAEFTWAYSHAWGSRRETPPVVVAAIPTQPTQPTNQSPHRETGDTIGLQQDGSEDPLAGIDQLVGVYPDAARPSIK
jgi:membrane protein